MKPCLAWCTKIDTSSGDAALFTIRVGMYTGSAVTIRFQSECVQDK